MHPRDEMEGWPDRSLAALDMAGLAVRSGSLRCHSASKNVITKRFTVMKRVARSQSEHDSVKHGAKAVHNVGAHEPYNTLLDTSLRIDLSHSGDNELLSRQSDLLFDSLFIR
mmetsp:Transcript_12986/g.39607  ORF Transcript_12986/g.39607 Transcript_12986/m.39607 type:complete len:112 (+) Transcript_12986:357-692(+)